jgi:hypothetical protein
MPASLMVTLDPVAITTILLCALGAGFMIRFFVALLIDEKQTRAKEVIQKRRPHLVKSMHQTTNRRNLAVHGLGELRRRQQGGMR